MSAQCPACGLHELVPVYLARGTDGRWRTMERGKTPTSTADDPANASADVVQIDACPMCNGAWFDQGELDLLDGQDAVNVETFLSEVRRTSLRVCPRGHGHMREHAIPGKVWTPVDRCPECNGLWLDGEERRRLAMASTREGQKDLTERIALRGAIYAAQLLTQLPVEVENPKRGTPWIVIALLSLLTAVFALQWLQYIDTSACEPLLRRAGGDQDAKLCLAPVAGKLRQDLGQLSAPSDWYVFFTHMFLHGNWAHLLGNLYFLYVFGDNVEEVFGRRRFIVLFLGAGLFGGLLEVLLTTNTATPIVGASGGIAGVMAAYLWCFPRNKLFQMILFVQVRLPAWVYLGFWVGFQAVMGLFSSGAHVAWFSHLGGFVFGSVMTPLVLAWRRRHVAQQVDVPAAGFFLR